MALHISSSVILSLDNKIVQFCALLPSITDKTFALPLPTKRRSSTDPSFYIKRSLEIKSYFLLVV